MKVQIKIDQVLYHVEVGDVLARPIQVQVDGENFEVWPEQEQTSALPAGSGSPISSQTRPEPARAAESKPPTGTTPATQANLAVTAPMPGVIIAISVKAGDVVTAGTELVVLEAMKMKNPIRATHAGAIALVRVHPGDSVKKGQILVEFSA